MHARLLQVARQQGQFLAKIISKHRLSGETGGGDLEAMKAAERPFKYSHKVCLLLVPLYT